ncbi:hypothetical protein Sjap_016791 [Stephania japonica]|uniref:HVA22-like protein n=1 Tax=Stephania japonica TaxID=461633 RepID=A0AAP0NL78_9MAGN
MMFRFASAMLESENKSRRWSDRNWISSWFAVSKMIGSFLTRGLVMVFGYAYPAFECYKTVEKNKPEIDELRFWCQYWILVAMMTVFERVGDIFISWLPMYSEAKLAFFIYLWYSKTKGTTYIYNSFFKPYLEKHEVEIDRNLLEMRARAGDFAVIHCRQAITYGQTRIFQIFQYIAAQSTSRPRSPQQVDARVAEPPPTAPTHPPAKTAQSTPQLPPKGSTAVTTTQPSTSTANTTTSQDQKPAEHELDSAAAAAASPTTKRVTKAVTKQLPKETTSKSMQNLTEAVQTEPSASLASENTSDSVMEDAIRITRGRLRRTRASTIH